MDVVLLLVHSIKEAWQKRKVMVLLFLNIKGAFLKVDNAQLIRNLNK